jgi:hypothetical protein
MKIEELVRGLAYQGVCTTMHYDIDKKKLYLDLETRAKSHLYLYEDGTLLGRYDYKVQINLNQEPDCIITDLCYEFSNALHGRSYCQSAWADLCATKGIKLETYI